ncbi:MAG: sialidase family protein [Planctomycetia bacterium]|nr:sialidase family protein [Planctomycetia bacterium]
MLLSCYESRTYSEEKVIPEESTAISDGSVNKYEAFPDVVRLANGELIAVYYAAKEHVSRDSVIVMIRSKDNGISWTSPKVIFSSPLDDRDPCIMQTREGTLLLSTMSADINMEKWPEVDQTMRVRILRSEDNGETWQDPIEIESPFVKLTACSSPIVQLADGDLLMPIYGRETHNGLKWDAPGHRDRTAIVRSKDNGKTWTDPIVIDESPERMNQEPSLCVLPSGRVYCMIRNRGGMTWSDDNGKTWTPIKYLDWPLDCPYLYPITEKLIVCGMRHRDLSPSITITVTTDGGMTWSKPQFMSEGEGAYPSIQRVTDDTYIYVYYRDETGVARIHRIYFQVADDGAITRISPDEFREMNK